MGCAEMGDVDQALLEPVTVEGLAAGASNHGVRLLRGFLARAGITKSISTIVELGVFALRMTVGTVQPHRSMALLPPLQLPMFGPLARRFLRANPERKAIPESRRCGGAPRRPRSSERKLRADVSGRRK